MFAFLLLALASPEVIAEQSDTKLSAIKGLSVSIPSEIGAAIKPYIDCLIEADNVAIGDGIKSDGDAMRAISARSRETCAPVRLIATTNASKSLDRYPNRSTAEKSAMIDAGLAGAESLSSAMADMMDQYKTNAEATENSNAPNN